MRTDHRPQPKEFGYAVLPDWQEPRWPAWQRTLLIISASALGWAAFTLLALWIVGAFL